jgi:hypothetical protein
MARSADIRQPSLPTNADLRVDGLIDAVNGSISLATASALNFLRISSRPSALTAASVFRRLL